MLTFEFLAEKIEFFGRENLFSGLHRLLVENQDSVDRAALWGGLGGSAPLVLKKLFAGGPGGALKIG